MLRLSALAAVLAMAACTDAPTDPASAGNAPLAPAEAAGLAVAALPDGPVVAYVDTTRQLIVRTASGEPVVVDAGPVSSHSQAGPRLAALPDGALVAAYVVEQVVEGRRFPASELYITRSEDGGATWGQPVQPYADAGFPTGHTFHSLAAGADGTVVVAWLDGTARDRWRRDQAAEAAAHRHAGHVPIRLVHNGEDHSTPAADDPEPGTQLHAAVSMDGGRTFSAPAQVASGTCQCCRTALHVADDGSLYATWRHIFPNSERDIALARSTDGGASWDEPVKVFADRWALDGCPHAGPAVTTDASGTVHVAWPTGAEDRSGLWRATSADGGMTFDKPVALASPAPLGQFRAVQSGGDAVFALEDQGEISVFAVGASDTLRVEGTTADLAAGDDGWHLLWHDGEAVRLHSAP
ncbi:MAG: sialidase family protein [Bacteroidota bacterium]